MSTLSHQTLPFSPTGRPGRNSTLGKPNTEINRFGLHDLAGELQRDGADPVTIQILEEANFLPRNVPIPYHDEAAGDKLKSQTSLPPFGGKSELDDLYSGSMGLGALRFSPMKLNRVYGRPGHLPVINLTGIHKSHVVYAASNVIVYFDYYSNSQHILQGHKEKISCIGIDSDTKYLATGELVKEPTLIIWNLKTGFPMKRISYSTVDGFAAIRSLGFVGSDHDFIGVIHQTEESKVVKMAEGVASEEPTYKKTVKQSVSIWFFGEEDRRSHHHTSMHASARTEIPTRARSQSLIHFSPDVPHHFVTTGDHHVVFYTWLRHERKILTHVPTGHLKFMKRLKRFTATIWVKDSVITASASGYIVEWRLQGPLGLEPEPNPHHNVKEFRRFIKVDEHIGLTALVAYKDFIVVGDEEGGVRFLDNKFRLLRWTRTASKGSIRSISFNCIETPPVWKTEMRSTYHRAGYDHNTFHRNRNSAVYDYTYGGEKYQIPSETTLERKPLHDIEQCLDMVVGYEDGSVAYFHIAEEKVDTLLRETLGPERIVAMDASPTTKHLAISTQLGAIQLINYKTNDIIQSQKIFKKEVEVTSLRFHPSGAFLVIGTSKGTIFFRRSFTLGLMDNPLHASKDSITKIVFSSCGLFMGIFDKAMTVSLCNYDQGRSIWGLKGKHRSHYRPIVDIIFFFDTIVGHQRFFSLGQDKRLIEYDISQSVATKGLKILTVTFVEQTHVPTAMVFDAPFVDHGPVLIYSTTNNKIKIFDQNACKVRKTCQGPEYGAPLRHMLSISPDSNKGRTTNFILMTLGNKIGLIKTPVDGNPYKYMAVLAHPTEIQNVGVGSKGSEIFTRAESDKCIFMWIPDVLVLENCAMAGGLGITPFKHYLDAGLPPEQSIVADIENIFYHFLMKRAKDQHELVQMNLTIPLSDIPTVMRTCGHFPTEMEIDMLQEEVEFILGLKYGTKQEEISLDDFIVLFANHKDAGVHDHDILHAFEILGEENQSEELCISRENFVAYITTKGESLKEMDLPLFLPGFYRDIIKEVEVVKAISEPWFLKQSSFMSSSHSLPLERRSRAISLYGEDNSPTNSLTSESRESIVQFQDGRPSTKFPIKNMHVRPSRVFSVMGEDSQPPEDDDDEFSPPGQEMIDDITVNFFIEHLLPKDVRSGLSLDRDELTDDLNHLRSIIEEHAVHKPMDEIVKRWKDRDEWRYFKEVFEKLKHENIPMELRIAAVIEMDHFFRTGQRCDMSTGAESETVRTADDNEAASQLPVKKKKKGHGKHEDIEEERLSLDDDFLITDPFAMDKLIAENDDSGESTGSAHSPEDDNEEYGSGGNITDEVLSDPEATETEEEMETDMEMGIEETVAESDVTEIPTSRPFTGIPESESDVETEMK